MVGRRDDRARATLQHPARLITPGTSARLVTSALLLLLPCLLPASLEAQTPRVAIGIPTALVEPADIDRLSRVTVEGLESGLSDAGIATVALDPSRLPMRPATLEIAAKQEADYLLRPRVDVAGDRVTLVVSAYEVESGAYVAGAIEQGRSDVSYVDSVRVVASELAPQILRAFEVRRAGAPPELPETLVDLEFVGPDEDVRVVLGDDREIGTLSSGVLEAPFFPVPVGSRVGVRVEKENHYPKQFEFEVEQSEMRVELPALEPHRRFEAMLRYRPQRLFAAGAGVRFYLSPGNSFVGMNGAVGALPSVADWTNYHYNFDMDARIGTYLFFPVTSLVRMGASVGGGTSMSLLTTSFDSEELAEDPPQFLADPYVILGSLFIELNTDILAPYVELDLQYGVDTAVSFLEPGLRPYATVGVVFR